LSLHRRHLRQDGRCKSNSLPVDHELQAEEIED
jgi:hypothetical protein